MNYDLFDSLLKSGLLAAAVTYLVERFFAYRRAIAQKKAAARQAQLVLAYRLNFVGTFIRESLRRVGKGMTFSEMRLPSFDPEQLKEGDIIFRRPLFNSSIVQEKQSIKFDSLRFLNDSDPNVVNRLMYLDHAFDAFHLALRERNEFWNHMLKGHLFFNEEGKVMVANLPQYEILMQRNNAVIDSARRAYNAGHIANDYLRNAVLKYFHPNSVWERWERQDPPVLNLLREDLIELLEEQARLEAPLPTEVFKEDDTSMSTGNTTR